VALAMHARTTHILISRSLASARASKGIVFTAGITDIGTGGGYHLLHQLCRRIQCPPLPIQSWLSVCTNSIRDRASATVVLVRKPQELTVGHSCMAAYSTPLHSTLTYFCKMEPQSDLLSPLRSERRRWDRSLQKDCSGLRSFL
jgi:hypothetical protein